MGFEWYALALSGVTFLALFGVWATTSLLNLGLKVLFLFLAVVDLGLTVLHLQKVGVL